MGADDFKMKAGFEPVEELGENGAKLDSPNIDKPKADEPKVDEPKVDEPKANEPKVDKPKVDEPKIDEPKASEPKEDEPKADEPKVDEPKSSLNKNKIAELTKDQFKTEEELYEAYSSMNKVDGKTLMESINKQVQEKYGDKDLTYADLVYAKNINYEDMDSLELIKNHLRFEDPEITDTEIKAEMHDYNLMLKSEAEIKEMIELEQITQDQYDLISAKMISRARKAKKALMEDQASIDLDAFEIHVPAQSNANAAPQKTEKEIQDELAHYDAVIEGFSELKLNVGTKDSPFDLSIKVTDDDRNGIKSFCEAEEGKNFVDKRWMGNDGRVKMDVLSKDIYKILNYDRDVAVGFTQGKSEGLKEAIKENDNIDLRDKGGSKAPIDSGKNVHANIAKEIN